jgi:hypothetical protein
MKKFIIGLAFLLVSASATMAQSYFQATMQNLNNVLIFKIKPVNGNITLRFSAIELFVRVPNPSAPFTFGTPITDAAFAGMTFTPKGPNTYGVEPGFNNFVFEWIGGATAVPASATTYTQNVEYELFRVALNGPTGTINMQLAHNTDPSQVLTYINISDNLSASWSCVNNAGNTIGNAFYGPGFFTTPAPNTFTNHLLPLTNVPVPVKFNGFTATKRDNTALLNWSVENESPVTSHYEIERSTNGVSFSKIARVEPKSNGATSNAYTLTDLNLTAVRTEGVIYYRIKQYDKDGQFVYSEIKSVRLDGKGFAISVYPNPVKDVATLTIDLVQDGDVIINITDAAGKQVKQLQVQGFKGLNTKKVDMLSMASGTYLFKISTGTELKTLSVVKGQ